MPIPANALAIMAKAPVPGTVKTRLAPPLTLEQAADFYRALLADQLEHLRSIANAERYLAYAPDDAEVMMRELGGNHYRYLVQRGADLGQRMNQIFVDLWHHGHRNAVVIGSDLPALPIDIFHQAFAQLDGAERRVVLGPSHDGGYYLIGMNQPAPGIFENMTWGHDRVLAETTARLNALGVSFSLLPKWFDLDTAEDLRRLRGEFDLVMRQSMPRTRACLEELSRLGFVEFST